MSELPLHCEIGPLQRVFAVVCVVAAAGLVAWQLARLLTTPGVFRWWMPLIVAAGMLFADLASGILHWSAGSGRLLFRLNPEAARMASGRRVRAQPFSGGEAT